VTEAVFSPEVVSGRELRTVELAPGKVVALGVKDHEPARPKPLEEVRAEVMESARLAAAGKLAAARADEVVAALGKGADWAASVAQWKGEPATSVPKPVGRDDPAVPAAVRGAAFKAPAPAGAPRHGTAALANGDAAVWTVTAVERGNLSAMNEDERKQAADQARDRSAMSDATVYITSMRARAEVDVNPQLFE
jgi:peptidyl-prolyl cis-trans isomerase D